MNREIKFRGKRTSDGEWVYGSLITTENGGVYIGGYIPSAESQIAHIARRNGKTSSRFAAIGFYMVLPGTVGQYTGLYDVDGKELYEGDIVQGWALADEGGFGYMGKIIFHTENTSHGWHVEDAKGGAWELKQIRTRISLDHITGEIAGNIHDNPELLKR